MRHVTVFRGINSRTECPDTAICLEKEFVRPVQAKQLEIEEGERIGDKGK
jgi:hypothetical protein